MPKFAAVLFAAAITLTPVAAMAGNDLAKYCKADIQRLCPNVEPGGGKIIKCLKSKAKMMSVGCAQALQKMKG
ncbi:cysteine rich repeat-containing protein [Camelimonas abortus]|uniref:Cysteine rich repeat-containing protein n=1 Tax=Camelimonas abortus TaxID=1017184 RepID=A0ABV7LDV3_9HYPH